MARKKVDRKVIDGLVKHLEELTAPQRIAPDTDATSVDGLVETVISLDAIEEARRVGMEFNEKKKEYDELLRTATKAINDLLAYALDGRPTRRFFVNPSNAAITMGGYCDGDTLESVLAAWRALPEVIAQDVTHGKQQIAEFEEKLRVLRAVANGVKALSALAGTEGDDRQATVIRAMTDASVAAALDAAEESGVEDAVTYVIRSQANAYDTIDSFMRHVTPAHKKLDKKIRLRIALTDRAPWQFGAVLDNRPWAEVRIESDPLKTLLQSTTETETFITGLMNLYFNGDMTFPASGDYDPMKVVGFVGDLFRAAFDDFKGGANAS